MRPLPSRESIVLAAALVGLGLLHFVAPNRRQHDYSVRLGPLTYCFNADSPTFARLVVRFPRGFTEVPQGRTRLMRPLYPTLGWLAQLPLRPLRGLIPAALAARAEQTIARAHHPETWVGIDARDLLLAWGTLVLVNFGLTWLALYVVFRGLAAVYDRPLALRLAILCAAHFDVFDYLWTPQAEAFNLLVGALWLVAATTAWRRRRLGLGAAVATGVALLGKSLAFPVVGWCLAALRTTTSRWLKLCVCLAFLGGPSLAYVGLLKVLGVTIHHHEAEKYRQFVWMADAVRDGRAADVPVRLATGLLRHGQQVALVVAVPLAVLGVLAWRCRRSLPPAERNLREQVVVYVVACAAFWCASGNLMLHHTVMYLPPLALVLGRYVSDGRFRGVRLLEVTIGLWIVWQMLLVRG